MPDSRKRLVLRIIHENGGRLVRQKRHLVFRFPGGRMFVVPKTPSDLRAWRNSHAALMRFLRAPNGRASMSVTGGAGSTPGKRSGRQRTNWD